MHCVIILLTGPLLSLAFTGVSQPSTTEALLNFQMQDVMWNSLQSDQQFAGKHVSKQIIALRLSIVSLESLRLDD